MLGKNQINFTMKTLDAIFLENIINNDNNSLIKKGESGKKRMISNRIVLMVVGLIVLLMGILGAIPDWGLGTEPMWHAAIKILVGLIALVIAYMNKG